MAVAAVTEVNALGGTGKTASLGAIANANVNVKGKSTSGGAYAKRASHLMRKAGRMAGWEMAGKLARQRWPVLSQPACCCAMHRSITAQWAG